MINLIDFIKNFCQIKNMSEKVVQHLDGCRCNESPEEWWVDSPEHFNCFFTYLKANLRPHTLQEIASLLHMSISAVTTIEKKAIEKLRQTTDL
jgi:DNA-directed RNA polymerase sigma subunit (sigma70/sigma32)